MNVELIGVIAYAGVTTITTIISLIKGKSLKGQKSAQEELLKTARVLQKLPNYINEAEKEIGSGKGALKKTIVLQKTELECAKTKTGFDVDGYSREVERILETPQKKIEKESNNEDNSSPQCGQQGVYTHSEENKGN